MIARDPAAAAQQEFDLLVIGGGIYGASVLREAAHRGLSACLCEAGDFGGGTSQNSLRILHGGLRYLQTLDLRRFRQSVAARREVAGRFPTLVRPLDCMMPLYAKGMKRAAIMRVALGLNDALSAGRNHQLPHPIHLERGKVLDASETRNRFPLVRAEGLEGAAHWPDYFMVSSERILMETLHDACTQGAIALNYARVLELIEEGGTVRGVQIQDDWDQERHVIRAKVVVNCTGPSVRVLARGRGGDPDLLFRPSLAFNLLLNVPLPSPSALAVAAPRRDAPMLFLIPQGDATLAGTWHAPRPLDTVEALPTPVEVETYLEHLRAAIPGFNVTTRNVVRVLAGLLPADAPESAALTKREVVKNHGACGGLNGFFSVVGVKYTTASDVARQILEQVAGPAEAGAKSTEQGAALQTVEGTQVLIDADRLWTQDPAEVRETFRQVRASESVRSLDDLIFRRTNWATTVTDLGRLRHRIQELTAEDRPL